MIITIPIDPSVKIGDVLYIAGSVLYDFLYTCLILIFNIKIRPRNTNNVASMNIDSIPKYL